MKTNNELKIPSFKLPKELLGPTKSAPLDKKPNDFNLNNIPRSDIASKGYQSKFNFIKAHDGLQKGHIHVLLGRTNKGKSSLILELIIEQAKKGVRSLLFLSEGNKGDIRVQIELLLAAKRVPKSEYDSVIKNIVVLSEYDISGKTDSSDPLRWVNSLFRYHQDYRTDIVFLDNISGLKYGNCDPETQSLFIKILNDTCINTATPLVVAVHQSKGVAADKELEVHDIRANQSFSNIPSYIYALNDFCNLSKDKRIIKILKSRCHALAIGKYFETNFVFSGKTGH